MSLFSSEKSPIKQSPFAAPTLKPSGSGMVDIINDFRWNSTELGSKAHAEIPYIYMREYKSTRTGMELIAQAAQASQLGNAVGKGDPYESLYSYDDPTGFIYRMPYFTSDYYDIANSFKDSDGMTALQGLGSGANDMLKTIGQTAKGKLGIAAKLANKAFSAAGDAINFADSAVGMKNKLMNAAGGTGKLDVPKIWDSTSPRSVSFGFYLFNTYKFEDIKSNWDFIHLFRYQNVINKLTLVTAIPPVFYEVMVPGQHYSKGSYVSSLKISNVGVVRAFKPEDVGLGGSVKHAVHIPDAYSVTITLQDFSMPSQNLLDDLANNKVQVG